jgi:hypothetical protein
MLCSAFDSARAWIHWTLGGLAVDPQFEKRASDVQLRIADRITAFAGSMHFVFLHALLFALGWSSSRRAPGPP